jgi:hypothetical protein
MRVPERNYQGNDKGNDERNPVSIVFRIIIAVLLSLGLTAAISCTKRVRSSGFLTDYSSLELVDGCMRYIDEEWLGTFSKFIIEPVKVRAYHKQAHGQSMPDKEAMETLINHLHNAMVREIGDRYMIVSQPGPGVARLRVAITDIESSMPVLNLLSRTGLTAIGAGSVTMEAELLDTQSGEQIAAIIEKSTGTRASLSSLTDWGDAKEAMDSWARKFRECLDDAHRKE